MTNDLPDGGAADAPWIEVLGSPHLAGWLAEHQVSLAFTTYQTGKLFLLGSRPDGTLTVFERTFSRAMGLWADGQTLWLGTSGRRKGCSCQRAAGTAGEKPANRDGLGAGFWSPLVGEQGREPNGRRRTPNRAPLGGEPQREGGPGRPHHRGKSRKPGEAGEPMRIAYLTTDEVNEQLAQQMAAACGVTLCPLGPGEVPPDGQYDAVLYDWDYLPAARQREVLAELLSGQLPHAVGLHSYDLEAGPEGALRRNTVMVYRRLQPRLFRSLRLAARAARTANAPGRTPEDERDTDQGDGAA
jgi:hypothetical protein